MRTSSIASIAAVLLTALPFPSRSEEPAAPPPTQPAPEVKIEGTGTATKPEAKPDAPAPAPEGTKVGATGANGGARNGATSPAAREEPGEEIVVTATRSPRRIGSLPTTVNVIPREVIATSPAKTVDELLRVDPSFGLFRRSSSVAADPSSQGLKLRGVGTSAVSRALVLVDGIPENDPFAGWISWRSIPRAGIQSIEVAPGGASSLYGNYALGGVVQILSRPIADREMELTSDVGSLGTAQIGGQAMQRWGSVRSSLDGEFMTSDGYPVVAPYQRGAIDTSTPSKHASLRARVEGEASPDLSYGLRGGFFWEDLDAGTEFTTAMVRKFEYAGTGRYVAGQVGTLDLAVFGHTGVFLQDRTRVRAPVSARASEEQSAHQYVPTDDVGSSVLWTSQPLPLGGTHTFNAGVDGRWIGGETRETIFAPPTNAATLTVRDAKGQQWLYGAFVQDNYDVTRRIALNVAVRYDRWDNQSASRREFDSAGAPTASRDFPGRSDEAFSPKVGLNVRPADWLALRTAAYRSFRAPTLDELLRPFQVGLVRTEANENLGPETLRGAEAGVDLLFRGATARVTGFWNEVDDPITNVTCSSAGICPVGSGPNLRQRLNLGTARIRGVEASTSWTFLRRWSVGAAYTYAENEITDAPGQPQVLGKRLPQDPLHMATASLGWADPRFASVRAQVRYVGRQYEDDLNTQPMGEAYLVDLFASWAMTPRFDLFFAVENVLDRTYLVGRAGVDTIGQPRFVHGGVRFRTGG
jgi:iron complex outermembrane recepter protein